MAKILIPFSALTGGKTEAELTEFKRVSVYNENRERTDKLESAYDVLCNYKVYTVKVADDGAAVSNEKVAELRDAGKPMRVWFENPIATISGTETKYGLSTTVRADKLIMLPQQTQAPQK